MGLSVLITGASGMVGKGILLECLEDNRISEVVTISRRSINLLHPKHKEIIVKNFELIDKDTFSKWQFDGCFFCLGVSSVGLSKKRYYSLTYDLTINFARALLVQNRKVVFCYVSGKGTNSDESGNSSSWSAVKGKTENHLLAMPFRAAFMFRPGFIQPMKGIKSRTLLYNIGIKLFMPFVPFVKKIMPNSLVTSIDMGKAMINCVLYGYHKGILESIDINRLAAKKPVQH